MIKGKKRRKPINHLLGQSELVEWHVLINQNKKWPSHPLHLDYLISQKSVLCLHYVATLKYLTEAEGATFILFEETPTSEITNKPLFINLTIFDPLNGFILPLLLRPPPVYCILNPPPNNKTSPTLILDISE